jgi:hypothetical protein
MKSINVLTILSLVCLTGGCTNLNPIGNRITQKMDNTLVENGSPVTLTIADGAKSGTATGTGPARFTSITESEIQTIQTGTVPRDLWVKLLPDGTRQFNLSTGTDIRAKDVKVNPVTGEISIGEFSTIASEPLRAANEGLDRFIEIVKTLAPEQRQAIVAQLEAQRDAATGIAKAGFQAIIDAIKGVP